MELNEFVTKVLREVIEGIEEAHRSVSTSEAGARGAAVAPRIVIPVGQDVPGMLRTSDHLTAISISFDVGLVAVEHDRNELSGSGKAAAKLQVLGFAGAGGSLDAAGIAERARTETRANRVQFSIPVLLPENETQTARAKEKAEDIAKRRKTAVSRLAF